MVRPLAVTALGLSVGASLCLLATACDRAPYAAVNDGAAPNNANNTNNDDPLQDPDAGRPESAIVDFALGAWSGCSAHADGSVRCWGSNIGDLSRIHAPRWHPTPTRISGVEGAINVAVGNGWGCALDDAGSVKCWGYMGSTETAATRAIPELAGAVEIDGKTSVLCGRFADGRVRCRGSYWDSERWYDIRDLDDAVGLSVGGDYACAARQDTTAVCWGRFLQERGNPPVHDLPNPIVDDQGEAITGVLAVEASAGLGGLPPTTYLVMDDGRLLAMGANEYGQLGAVTPTSAPTPVPVPLDAVASVTAGQGYACALGDDAALSCWGINDVGTLGDGTLNRSAAPVRVALDGVERIEAGDVAVCALADGRLWCWGSNAEFQLGARVPGPDALVPTLLPDTEGVLGAALDVPWQSSDPKGCYVAGDGAVFCAGQDESSEVFNGGPTPTLSDVTQVAVGSGHSCAVREDASVWCWGFNYVQQLGTDTPPGGFEPPVQARGVTGALEVGVSQMGSCALLDDGGVSCWGGGPVVSRAFGPPTRREDITGAVELSVADSVACALLRDGSAVCWGGLIQHPSGAALAFATATGVPAPERLVRVAADDALACALGASGALYCWRGMGSFPYEASPGPPPFPALQTADEMPPLVDVDAGDGRVCGVTDDGEVWCMQEFPDEQEELPTGALPTPARVEGIDDALAVVVTYGAACAITPRGLACWGEVPFHQGLKLSAVPVPLDY